MEIGRVGIWSAALDALPASAAQACAAELEQLGYGTIWVPEAVSRDAFVNAGLLLAGTGRVVVATGVASIWLRSPQAAAAAHRTLNEAYPGRFLLGLGVSHQPAVEGLVGRRYERPVEAMRDFLESMDRALVLIPEAAEAAVRVLAALGPRMLGLAAEMASGAHTYLVTPEHTAMAREAVGQGLWVLPEQAVVLESDPSRAREVGRAHLAIYLNLANYVRNWKRLGFGDDDFLGGGSDRLVDALVAWGDLDRVTSRIRQHLDAGADHVAIQVLRPSLLEVPREEWRELAPATAELA